MDPEIIIQRTDVSRKYDYHVINLFQKLILFDPTDLQITFSKKNPTPKIYSHEINLSRKFLVCQIPNDQLRAQIFHFYFELPDTPPVPAEAVNINWCAIWLPLHTTRHSGSLGATYHSSPSPYLTDGTRNVGSQSTAQES